MVAEEFSWVAMDNSGPEKSGPIHRRRVQEAAREAKEGAAIHFTPEVAIGQKPA